MVPCGAGDSLNHERLIAAKPQLFIESQKIYSGKAANKRIFFYHIVTVVHIVT